MAMKKGGLLSNNLAIASIIFVILAVAFIVCAILKVNTWVDFALMAVMMMVGFYGILPHAFEPM